MFCPLLKRSSGLPAFYGELKRDEEEERGVAKPEVGPQLGAQQPSHRGSHRLIEGCPDALSAILRCRLSVWMNLVCSVAMIAMPRLAHVAAVHRLLSLHAAWVLLAYTAMLWVRLAITSACCGVRLVRRRSPALVCLHTNSLVSARALDATHEAQSTTVGRLAGCCQECATGRLAGSCCQPATGSGLRSCRRTAGRLPL